ncbi:MAG: deoxyribodipyrimidine photo-lyase [Planctomycetota bacterium]|nr:deoxyribodipyrimidine photo-lyase [Planctomycetota bacterium]
MCTLLWFRNDLRLTDQPALAAAVARGGPVVPVYIVSDDGEGDWPLGSATKWWLHRSLKSLDAQLQEIGSRLILRRGSTQTELDSLIAETAATGVVWGRRYEPAAILRDQQIKSRLKQRGILAESHNTSLLWEPWTIQTGTGGPYKVFTPFWRKCLQTGAIARPIADPVGDTQPVGATQTIPSPAKWPRSVRLAELDLEPRIPWDAGLRETWLPGRDGVERELCRFESGPWSEYSTDRDFPEIAGTSRLSPHLHFGEVSPRTVWHRMRDVALRDPRGVSAIDPYLRQLVWREFAFHLLYHFSHTPREPLRPEFARFPWRTDDAGLRAWQTGRTGYPLVDAGMRELWRTGWMHNRVRMAAASFLVKDLLIPWQLGAEWFWDTLVDADLANNTLGWQWTAGCGADAAPYFRVFNPVSQGEKFDAAGNYVRHHVPELARLPNRWIQQPFCAPREVLAQAGVELGVTYPHPIVDHAEARVRALAALATITGG